MLQFFSTILYYPFINLLTLFTGLIPGHYAAAGIILLTLLVRFILLVPSRHAAEAQRKQAELQPLISELQREYGDDKQGFAAAQMDLLKQNDINPVFTCLLTFVQIPILYVLYYSILHGLNTSTEHLYSWVPHLTSINPNFLGINLLKEDHYFILPILAALLQFVQVRMMLPQLPKTLSDDPAQRIQRQTAYIFPFFTLLIAYRVPAGVALYWIISTLFTIIQQYFVIKNRPKVVGVQKIVSAAEKAHPESTPRLEAAKEVVEESTKGTTTVTVRRKKR